MYTYILFTRIYIYMCIVMAPSNNLGHFPRYLHIWRENIVPLNGIYAGMTGGGVGLRIQR